MLPAIPEAACLVYRGDYGQWSRVVGGLLAWLQARRLVPARPMREVYLQFSARDPGALRLPRQYVAAEAADLVTEVQIPPNPVDEPFDIAVHVNLSNASGVGQTSGLTYRASGAATIEGTAELPGSFDANWSYRLIPPNPIRVIPGNPVRTQQPMTVSEALSSDGAATEVRRRTSGSRRRRRASDYRG